MKKIPILIFQMLCVGSFAGNVPLNQLGHVFNNTNITLVWSVPTNNLPQRLWVYRALPSEFAPAAISNLMTLGAFTANDKNKNAPPGILSFVSPNSKRKLWIYPERGYIDYNDYEADDMHITEGVPDEKRAFELATNYLSALNIDRSQLAKKSNGELRIYTAEETAMLYKERGMPAYATNIHMRGVYFVRSLDGVDFIGNGGRGGCEIEFGHHAKVSRMLLCWRTLERDKFYPVATPETLLKWIREGKAVYEPSPDYDIDWSSVKRMAITKITPFYFGEVYSEPQNMISPFATLEATVDTEPTNLTVYLHCPIIDEIKP
jgi:hypothetical protein